MSYKRLYSFEVKKDTIVDKIVKNADGSETKSQEPGQEIFKFFVRKPSRSLRDDAELFKGKKYSEAIKGDLLPAALVSKRLINDEGIFSDQEKSDHKKLKDKFLGFQADIAKAMLVPEGERTDIQKQEIKDLMSKMSDVRTELSRYESAQLSVFDNTVEVYVRNKTIFFYTLSLAYQDVNGKETPFFGEDLKNWEKSYESKLLKYDEFEDLNDPFYNRVINKFIHIVTIWFITGEEDEKELKKLIDPVEETDEKVLPP